MEAGVLEKRIEATLIKPDGTRSRREFLESSKIHLESTNREILCYTILHRHRARETFSSSLSDRRFVFSTSSGCNIVLHAPCYSSLLELTRSYGGTSFEEQSHPRTFSSTKCPEVSVFAFLTDLILSEEEPWRVNLNLKEKHFVSDFRVISCRATSELWLISAIVSRLTCSSSIRACSFAQFATTFRNFQPHANALSLINFDRSSISAATNRQWFNTRIHGQSGENLRELPQELYDIWKSVFSETRMIFSKMYK